MWTYEAARVVDGPPGRVEAALASVVERFWSTRARVVAGSEGAGRMVAIDGQPGTEDPEVWLTWRLDPVAGGTLITLVLDEVESGPDPAEGLAQLLDLVEERVHSGTGSTSYP
ncbi:MAG TPA: hypothetical protein VJ804_09490 [Acidimicrobiales bacterium]|nr:hypothetical protein [Acidimicrobiales bacterium]